MKVGSGSVHRWWALPKGRWIIPCDTFGNESSSGRPIGEFQGGQFQLAAELEASRLLVYNAVQLRDGGEDFLVPAAMAKLHSSRMAQKVTSLCIDLYGGYGFTREYPVEKFYRDSKIGTIYEGTTNMQLQTIAKMLLG
jgi:alkylation response protein AidB-like acyl-CoA dehydrogenase